MTQRSPFRYFKTSPEIIRLAVMLYVRFPPSLRNVEDLLHERGIDVSHAPTGQRFGNSARVPGSTRRGTRTIGSRIRICRSGDENGPCCASGG